MVNVSLVARLPSKPSGSTSGRDSVAGRQVGVRQQVVREAWVHVQARRPSEWLGSSSGQVAWFASEHDRMRLAAPWRGPA